MTLDEVLDEIAVESTKIGSLAVLLASIKRQLDDALSGAVLPPEAQAKVDLIWARVSANRNKITDAINYIGFGFGGSPNVTITAIDTSAGFAMSRTSGKFPYACLQVSAAGIKATGTNKPFRDLEYEWEFDDPDGKQIFLNPVTGKLDNVNRQRGPQAAYCFCGTETKTFNIKLRIRGKNGNSYTTAEVVQPFTAFKRIWGNGEWWFANPAQGDGSGTSPENASSNPIMLHDKVRAWGAHVLIRRGDTFVVTGDKYLFLAGDMVVEDYGDPNLPDPIVTGEALSPARTRATLYTAQQWSNIDDAVVKGIAFRNKDGSGMQVRMDWLFDTGFLLSNVYFLNCDIQSIQMGNNPLRPAKPRAVNIGFWGGKCIQEIPPPGTNWTNGFCLGTAAYWHFFFGMKITANGEANFVSILDHWIYPDTSEHSLYAYMDFGPGNTSYAINTNVHGSDGILSPYHCVRDTKMHGTDWGIDASTSSNQLEAIFTDFVVERVAFNVKRGGFLFFCCEDMTVRDCLAWGDMGNPFFSVAGQLLPIFSGQFYRNKVHTRTIILQFTPAGWKKRQEVTDNIFVSTSPNALILNLVSADFVASNSLVDRNQYFATADLSRRIISADGGASRLTFEQWQQLGWDKNGKYADPKWRNPAIGVF